MRRNVTSDVSTRRSDTEQLMNALWRIMASLSTHGHLFLVSLLT